MGARLMSLPARHRQSGFTLMEVVLAFAIFALAFSVVLQILSGSVRAATGAGEASHAALLAQTLIDRIGVEYPVEEGSETGDFDDRYSYTLDIVELNLGDDEGLVSDAVPSVLYRVDVNVNWRTIGRERNAQFSTLKAAMADSR